MTVPDMRFDAVIALAKELGCDGVEFRNDLQGALFDGVAPGDVARIADDAHVRILALAEVKAFNHITETKLNEARALLDVARDCGAEAVSLIPRNDGQRLDPQARRRDLRLALRELAPILDEYDLIGLIEPLGFESCPLREKVEVVEEIEALAPATFKIVHDTFHHHLAGGGPVFAAHTGMVHISGVTAPVPAQDMTDAHRGLVDQDDRLGNLDQLRALKNQGYTGPVSMEAFAASVHDLSDPKVELSRSFNFITQSLAEEAA